MSKNLGKVLVNLLNWYCTGKRYPGYKHGENLTKGYAESNTLTTQESL